MMQVFLDIWALFAEMSLWLLLGLVVAGLVAGGLSERFVMRHLGSGGFLSTLKASLIGVPLPLCSCSVIPTGIGFYKKGASASSSLSFLISTPQTGIDSILLTSGALGWPFALVKVISAFMMGILGGLLMSIWPDDTMKNPKPVADRAQPTCKSQEKAASFWCSFYEFAFIELPASLAKPFLLGVILSAVVAYYFEPGSLSSLMGEGFVAMLIMLAFSLPLYVCSTASIPVAFMLAQQGVHSGAILLFLVAGPATNIATILMVAKNMGMRALICYLGVIILGSLLVGSLLGDIIVYSSLVGDHHEHLKWFHHLAGIVLMIIFSPHLLRSLRKFKAPFFAAKTDAKLSFDLSGLTCGGCVAKLERALKENDVIYTSLDQTSLVLSANEFRSPEDIIDIVQDQGFSCKQ
ncbi:MAG: permease [Planctomycetes bacterium]|nr:permease [Planctomycetota bacterium]